MYHEHQRPDRDDFVTIKWENIVEDNQHNFEKKTTPHVTLNENPYAYNSVMHYGALVCTSYLKLMQTIHLCWVVGVPIRKTQVVNQLLRYITITCMIELSLIA